MSCNGAEPLFRMNFFEGVKRMTRKLSVARLDLHLDLYIIVILIFVTHAAGQESRLNEINNRIQQAYEAQDYDTAVSLALEAVSVAEATFGPKHTQTAATLYNLAQMHFALGQQKHDLQSFAKAALAFKRSLGIFDNTPDVKPTQMADLLFYLGETYFYLNSFDDAEQSLVRALDIQKRELGVEHLDVAATCNDLGKTYESKGPASFTRAESFLKSALDIRRKQLDIRDERVLQSVTALTAVYVKENKFEASERLLEDRLAELHRGPGGEDRASALTMASLANVYLEEGRYAGAEQLLQPAITTCQEKRCPEFPSVVDILGRLYMAEGRFAEADRVMRAILSMYPKGQESEEVARELHNLALLSESEKNYVEAETLLEQSLAMLRKIKGPGGAEVAGDLEELGRVKLDVGKYKEAEALLKRAVDGFSSSLGDSSRLAAALNNLATLYRSQHNYRQAAATYQRAIKMVQKATPNSPYVGRALNNLGELNRATGHYGYAESTLKRSISAEEKAFGSEHYELAAPLWNLAAVYQAQQRFEEAKPLLDRGLHNLEAQFEQHFTYMTEKERLEFLNSVSSLFNSYLSFCVARCRQDPDLRSKTYDLLLWQKGVVATSIAGLRTQVAASGDKDALAVLKRLNDEKSEVAGMLYMLTNGVPVSREAIQNIQQKASEDERELVRRVPLLAERKQLARSSWRDVQGALKEKEAAIEVARFALFDGKKWTNSEYYLALVITPNTTAPNVVLFGPGKALEAAGLTDYCSQIFKPEALSRCTQVATGGPASSGSHGSFYEAFWKPLESAIGGMNRIFISPAGFLNEVAIGIIPDSSNMRLVDRYDLRIVNSTKDLLRSKHQSAVNSAVLIGNPKFLLTEDEHRSAVAEVRGEHVRIAELAGHPVSSGWIPRGLRSQEPCPNLPPGGRLCPLSASENEVKSVYDLLRSRNWVVDSPYTQAHALEEVVKGVQHPRLLHIATHGFFLADQSSTGQHLASDAQAVGTEPMVLSGLYLAGADHALNQKPALKNIDDGVLTALEASGLDLAGTELVVLSACDTGLGEMRASEGIFGLRRALQESGAESVMLTMWSVPDSDTQKLVTEFYKKWLSGMDKHEALREAQQELRNDVRSRFEGEDRPYYWGAFVLVGP
jgi:CHAT domain-containing protein/tetratricopeptide (TPR) repeat protein